MARFLIINGFSQSNHKIVIQQLARGGKRKLPAGAGSCPIDRRATRQRSTSLRLVCIVSSPGVSISRVGAVTRPLSNVRDYCSSPKSALNAVASFSGQSEVGSSLPVKKRRVSWLMNEADTAAEAECEYESACWVLLLWSVCENLRCVEVCSESAGRSLLEDASLELALHAEE